MRKIELFERLDARQLRITNTVVDGVPVALFALDGQQRFEILDVTVVLLYGGREFSCHSDRAHDGTRTVLSVSGLFLIGHVFSFCLRM